MKYYVDDVEVLESVFKEVLEQAVQAEVEEHYDDTLDECYPPYKIGCCTFYASRVLKELDPIAYRCGISDFVDAELSDKLSNFESAYEDEISNYKFRTEEEEAE